MPLNETPSWELSGLETLPALHGEHTTNFWLCLLQGKNGRFNRMGRCESCFQAVVIRLCGVDPKYCFFDHEWVFPHLSFHSRAF